MSTKASALPKRQDVPIELTWDFSHIFPDKAAYNAALAEIEALSADFTGRYEGHLRGCYDPEFLRAAFKEYEELGALLSRVSAYSLLPRDVDRHNSETGAQALKFEALRADIDARLSFFTTELMEADTDFLGTVAAQFPPYSRFLQDILEDKPYRLSSENEKLLATLQPVLDLPEAAYNQTKLSDIHFPPVQIVGGSHALSFVLYENNYAESDDDALRRAAFARFSDGLSHYRNTIACDYFAQIKKEKIISDLRGFPSVINGLLHGQRVSRDLYDRQIDLIMTRLAPVMRRYARLLQRSHGLKDMHYADLKLKLDSAYAPQTEIGEAKRLVRDALSVLGPDYLRIVDQTLDERRVDFAQNFGKSTGGYCQSPYGVGSYILLNWNGQLSEVFTLVHEIGHAGHFGLAAQKQNYLNYDNISWYLVEAPSTCNELLLASHLLTRGKDDPRFRRWVLASQIANTYYHNFVTHLLEAAYQREVYRRVDDGDVLQADDFSSIYREKLGQFWGDAIVYDPGCELTWMRQPHYYNGLYSYTYSAGLTIATSVSFRMAKEGQVAVSDWLRTLEAGGSLKPLEFARSAGVDISGDGPLLETIDYINSLVNEIERLTDEIGDF